MSKSHTARVLLKQQLNAKVSTLFIWLLVWSLLLLLFATVFNSLSKDAAESSKVFRQLPSGVFNSFNIDPSSYLTRIESFISGQFLSVYMLAGCIFSFTLGVGLIGKKIESRVIATLLTKPISRYRLYAVQSLVSVLFLAVASTLLCGISLIIFTNLLHSQNIVSTSYFTSLFTGSGLLFIAFALLGQLLGTLLNGGKSVPIGAGIVVVSWFVNNLAQLAHIPGVVQKLSLFHYFDVALLRTSFKLAFGSTVQLIIIILVLFIIGRQVFSKKDIYI